MEFQHCPLFSNAEAKAFEAGGGVARPRAVIRAHRRMEKRLRELDDGSEVAFVQRHVGMLPSLRLERLASRGRRLVLDVDDAIWLFTRPEAGGHRFAFLKRAGQKVRWLAERADVVIAGNSGLADWLGRCSPNVTVVPSLVDPLSTEPRRHLDAERVVWGWIGSRSTGIHLEAAAETLAAAAASMPASEIELVVVGAGRDIEIPGVHVRQQPWSEQYEREALARMDIGLMPLPNNDWTRMKCAYKALVYMNAGVPVVADDVGVSAAVVGSDRGGLIAGSRAEWIEALAALTRDAALRRRLGAGARRRAEEGFSVQRWAPVLASAIRGTRTTNDAMSVARPSTS